MSILKTILALGFLISILFFLLGLKSQKGAAKGLINNKLAEPGSAPNSVSSADDVQPEKKVPPLKASLASAKEAIKETGGTITSESDSYISATYMSKIFKFVDDVEIFNAGDERVDIRSASRVGYSDRGVNKKRVESIRQALK